jgi:transcriptional regulator with XRE-family HTH domain
MGFSELRNALVQDLLTRIRAGEFSERSLARRLGISQPHMHHILANKRQMSWELADHIVLVLKIDLQSYFPQDEAPADAYDANDFNESTNGG